VRLNADVELLSCRVLVAEILRRGGAFHIKHNERGRKSGQ
jgi:hypothetical protein